MDNTSPYLGLRPYRNDEQENFYGRDNECAILVKKLLNHRLTLLFAASGVGKSSLLNAAVIPTLRTKRLAVVYHNDWVTHPVQRLQAAINKQLQHSEVKTQKDETLADHLHHYSRHYAQPLVLILDQFEEFFRYQRHNKTFKQLIQQLTQIIRDENLPVSLCLSMREDFALELNAFKPELPTLLFENFYRLEKLSKQATQEAILEPLKKAGYRFEEGLLKILLHDLLSRELDRDPHHLVQDADTKTAEPPYLQIVCSQLWELDKHDTEKMIRINTYRRAGKASGLLESYVERELADFSQQEKHYASKAFDHLISQRGTKMAYTADALAHTLRVNKEILKNVLDKLEKQWIVRKQKRDQTYWYELYHDMFSTSLDDWNTRWKNKMRTRQAIIGMSSIAIAMIGLYIGLDYWQNANHHQLRSNNKPDDYLEIYQGKKDSVDLFRQQRFLSETRYQRQQMEPDKCVKNCAVFNYPTLNNELIANLPLLERISAYTDDGQFDKAFALIDKTLRNKKKSNSISAITKLTQMRIPAALPKIVQQWQKNTSTSVYETITHHLPLVDSSALLASQPMATWINEGSDALTEYLIQHHYDPNPVNAPLLRQWGVEDITLNEYLTSTWLLAMEGHKMINPLLDILKNKKSIDDADKAIAYELIRIDAARRLVLLKTPKAIKPFITILNNPNNSNNDLRADIIPLLPILNATEASPTLIKLLENVNEAKKIRIHAAQALAKLNAPEASQALIHALNDEDQTIRNIAAKAFSTLKITTTIPVLIEQLKNHDDSIKAAAINALRTFNPPRILPLLINILIEGQWETTRAVEDFIIKNNVSEAIPLLIPLLTHKNTSVRHSAATILAKIQATTATQPLLAYLANKKNNRYFNEYIFSFLAQTIPTEIVTLLFKKLRHENEKIRNTAQNELETLKVPTITQVLIHELLNKNSDLRITMMEILGNTKTTEAIPALMQIVKQKPTIDNPTFLALRTQAIEALGQIGSKEVIPLLVKIQQNPDDLNQYEAHAALITLGADEAIPLLIDNIVTNENKDNAIDDLFLEILSTLKVTEAIPFLLTALNDENTNPALLIHTFSALKAIEAKQSILKKLNIRAEGENELTYYAIKALGELKAVEAIPLLINIVAHDNNFRQTAAMALARIGSVKAIPPLIRYVYNKNTAIYNKKGDLYQTSARRADNELYHALQSLAKQHHIPALNQWLNHLIAQDVEREVEEYNTYDREYEEDSDDADKRANTPPLTPQQQLARLNNHTLYRAPRLQALDQLMQSEHAALAKQSLVDLLQDKENNNIIGRRLYHYLADLNATEALPLIKTRLTTLTNQWQQWRIQRDALNKTANENRKQQDREGSGLEGLETMIRAHKANKPIDSAYTYAHTIARLAPQQGIALLEHPLAEARRGAWEGLAMLADVALVEQLDQQRALKKDHPLFYHAAYRAIDLLLIHIDANSRAKDRDALDAYLKKGVVDQQAVAPRIQWTCDRISETLVNLKRVNNRLAHWFDKN